ncbi:MAG TPA: SCO family protein, partial [Acidimicrobiales bacterium]
MRPLSSSLRPFRPTLKAGTLALCLTAGLVLAACGGSSAPQAPSANEGLVMNRPTPNHVQLENQHGQTVTLAGLKGKVVVLAPFLSLCQDECPLVTAAFIGLQRDVKAAGLGSKVVFVEATVDPGRDTVARLAAYQKEFGADWGLWTGTPANVAALWKPFGVSYQVV